MYNKPEEIAGVLLSDKGNWKVKCVGILVNKAEDAIRSGTKAEMEELHELLSASWRLMWNAVDKEVRDTVIDDHDNDTSAMQQAYRLGQLEMLGTFISSMTRKMVDDDFVPRVTGDGPIGKVASVLLEHEEVDKQRIMLLTGIAQDELSVTLAEMQQMGATDFRYLAEQKQHVYFLTPAGESAARMKKE